MDKFEYQPATLNAPTVKMDGPSGFVGTAENVRSREWAREFGKRNLMSAVRLAREVEVDFNADFETMDAMREAADADLYNLTPGTFVAQGEWKQRGYVLQSIPKGIHFGWVNTSLVIALLDGAWWRLQGVSLVPPSTDPPETRYGSGTGASVRMGGAVDSEFSSLTIYGKSVQDGMPTPESPVSIQVVEPGVQSEIYKTGYSIDASGNESENSSFNILEANVEGCTTAKVVFTINHNSGVTTRFHAYKADGTWIEQIASKSTSGSGTYSQDLTLPSLTAEIRISTRNTTVIDSITPDVILLKYGDVQTPIDLNGNVLASLPDGTKDVLSIDDDGDATLTKNVLHTTQAVTDGVTGTVGVDVLSSTGEIANGADVYYKATSPQTIALDPVTLPTITPGTNITVTAAVVPEVNAVFEPSLHSLQIRGDYSKTTNPTVYHPIVDPVVINCAGSQTTVDLDGNFLMKFDDRSLFDHVDIDADGNVVLAKNIQAIDLYSYTNWVKVDDRTYRSIKSVTGIQTASSKYATPKAMCDKFDVKAYNDLGYENITVIGTWDPSNAGRLLVKTTSNMSVDDFKDYINHGYKFYYKPYSTYMITLDPITMPGTLQNAEVSVSANVTPTIKAEWQLASYADYDYPHDYATDYQRPTTGGSVDTGRLVPCQPRITFFGPVVDPEITIAGNKYKVTASVASGARIEVDGKEKTVKLISEDGTVTDKFADALRGSGEGGGEYIFEQIPPGQHEITWDATFGVDVQWYDEVGEPPWSQS